MTGLTANWLRLAHENSAEFRLAAALASVSHPTLGPIRRHVEPITGWKKWRIHWSDEPDDPAIVWGGGGLVRNMAAVLQRRILDAVRHGPEPGQEFVVFPEWRAPRYPAALADIAEFVRGNVDEARIERLFRGLMLLAWSNVEKEDVDGGGPTPLPGAAYAIWKLCHLPFTVRDRWVRLDPRIVRRGIAGDGPKATRLASRRLRADGLSPAIDVLPSHDAAARRSSAALLLPIDWSSAHRLADLVLRPREDEADDGPVQEPEPQEVAP